MKIFAIGDIHLSFSRRVEPPYWDEVETYKPMDVFGLEWRQHYRKLYEHWHREVGKQDLVLLPGDISWAMKLDEAACDLGFIELLPGLVVAVAGNHDYWWQSLSRVRASLPHNMRVIQNDHLVLGDTAICGSRGWTCPGEEYFSEADLKIYHRELVRMENSLSSIGPGVKKIIVMTHFMPTNTRHEKNELVEIFQRYSVDTVVYGHLHGAASRHRLPEEVWGIHFRFVSADFLDFTPAFIMETSG